MCNHATKKDLWSFKLVCRLLLSCLFACAFAGSLPGSAQTLTPFEQQALLASLAGKTLTSLTLSGSVNWIAGSLKESGTVNLLVSPDGSLSETWTLPSQSHGVAATGFSAGRACSYTNSAGKQGQSSSPNCFQPVAWFAPWVALNMLSNGTLINAVNVTQPADTAAGLVKLQFTTQLTSAADPTTVAQLNDIAKRTAVTVTFSALTALPSSLTYDYVLDNDPRHVVACEIEFSSYSAEQGFVLPHHIQRYIQRTLQADITLNSVSAN